MLYLRMAVLEELTHSKDPRIREMARELMKLLAEGKTQEGSKPIHLSEGAPH